MMKKLGCSFLFKDGRRIPITLLLLEENFVLSVKNCESGHSSVMLMFGKRRSVNKPQRAYVEKLGFAHCGVMKEFRVVGECPQVKDSFGVSHFSEGSLVDVSGTSIGKGFAGPMKRHNFAGLRASHGVSLTHRSGGSTGQNQDIGRTYKGRKMAGQLGNKRVTIQNLRVVYVDVSKNIVGVKGAVPGAKNSHVVVRDAVKG